MISRTEGYTLTRPSDLAVSPDSSKNNQTDENSKTFVTLATSPSLSISSTTSSISSKYMENSNETEELFNLRTKNTNNPLFVFLNINSLRNKITDLRFVMEKCLPDILVIEETKLCSDFKTESFLISNYQKPICRDRYEFGGGIMQFVRKGMVCNRVSTLENPTIECIYSDLMVCKKRWVIVSIYRPPEASNLELFFKEMSSSLNSALDKYENVIIMGDINIDTHDIHHPGNTKLISFCDVYGLSNLVKDKTCYTKGRSSSIDVLLTNKPRCFQNTTVFETGLSDFHGLVSTLMKTHIPRLKPKVIKYRSYKKFDPVRFLQDVKNTDFKVDSNDADLSYRNLSSVFRKLVDKHAPLKTNVQRGNTAPFNESAIAKGNICKIKTQKSLIKILSLKIEVISKNNEINVFL